MYLVDYLHQRGIGVILDWVPAHFPERRGPDLATFDGTHLYEHADPRLGEHPDWSTLVFQLRAAAKCRLFSSAMRLFWLDKYHVDGLRVDAVAAMLYLDYGRREGPMDTQSIRWEREHRRDFIFLRELNRRVYAEYVDVIMVAEESTALAAGDAAHLSRRSRVWI